ncbi:DUF4153 domain-containing protein [Streptomyces sp. NPDC058424]|uniref:DUF4153 domain-containing protein n=1 Tax=Streptomyces sp. NPDC058424 TaxID=3346491 RepID=UPI00365D66B0
MNTAVLWAALATGVLSMVLLNDGVGVNLFLVALPAAVTAYFAARQAGRVQARPWTLAWGIGGLALLLVPAVRAAQWHSLFAVATAIGLASLALHGSRTWSGVVLSPFGLFDSLPKGALWGWRGVRSRAGNASGNVGSALRALAVTAVLLLVFGALFAGADAAFADLLSRLVPDTSVGDGPWRLVLFALGLFGALAAAHTAAAPLRWDSFETSPGRARGWGEWSLPLLVLCVLFAVFNAIQLAVLFGGYKAVLDKTGQTYSEYARQGFWQLLLATLLTLLVIVFALRWAPRGGPGDRNLVRGVLGTLCALTLVVVASAVRRMDMYVEAYGLTRLRISVVTVELWLGLVTLLIMAAGVWGARWLPRALAFGLASPDGLIAENNMRRYEKTHKFDLDYVRGLSADAVPALDRLREPMRSCVLGPLAEGLGPATASWYEISWGEVRARRILKERPPATTDPGACNSSGESLEYYR